MKTKNTIIKAIEYLSIYADKSEKFGDFKHISKAIDNPLKVSFIKQEKIESLMQYTQTKIVGTPEQRKKYFTSTSIQKLLQQMFKNELIRTEQISSDIEKQLRVEFCKDVDLFIEEDLQKFYSQELEQYIYNKTGSCMDKKPSKYFDLYKNFINVSTQIVGLKVGKSVIARAILWTKTTEKEIIKDVSLSDKKAEKRLKDKSLLGTISTHIQEKQYYLDRIYVASEFQNSNQKELQQKLYNKIKRALKLKRLDCFSLTYVKQGTNSESEKINYFKSINVPNFSIQIKQDVFNELQYYPYLDTFRWGTETRNNIKFTDCEDSCDYILDSTSGYYTEGDTNICDCCGERTDEDELNYSDYEEEYLCDECSTYIDERDDIVRIDNAVYNSFSGHYHVESDIG